MHVHVSAQTSALLQGSSEFLLEPRGLIEIKDKGPIETYWITRAHNPLHGAASDKRPTSLPGAHAHARNIPSTAAGQALYTIQSMAGNLEPCPAALASSAPLPAGPRSIEDGSCSREMPAAAELPEPGQNGNHEGLGAG